MVRVFVLLFLFFACCPCALAQQTAKSFESHGRSLRYWLYIPEGADKSDADATVEPLPLLLFLHGGGEGGSDLEKVKTHGPPKLIEEGKNFPFFVVSPQNPSETQFWDDQLLVELLNEIEINYSIDAERIYLSGLSRGAYGAWRLAIQNPTKFAALVPISGGGAVPYAKRIKHLPTWVFHGKKDTAIPFRESERMVDALRAAGSEVRFTVYPDAGHDAWTETYANPEIYEWLLAQRKTSVTRE